LPAICPIPGLAVIELNRDVLAWYATQTPTSLGSVPKAAPLKRTITAPVTAGANDF